MIRFHNTTSRSLEEFTSLSPGRVTMYNCGPTVYNFQHIGNLRAAFLGDIIRRTLEWNGYTVVQIINITDVGHLTDDADAGEDKIAIAQQREQKPVEEIIAAYTDAYIRDLVALNIKKGSEYPEGFPRATKHISEQIAMIQTLEAKGFTYRTSDGIYFDTAKFPQYAAFAKLHIAGLQSGARVEANNEKRNITDFALWKFFTTPGAKRVQEWDSPWGVGFPGWHIECSAMSMKYLGETLDIHTGGVDHIPVHHTNEIAQSECATGKQFTRYWVHNAHILVANEKMSKSLGNVVLVRDIVAKGYNPLSYRYWLLTGHYRTQVNFTWDAMAAADTAYKRLRTHVSVLPEGGVVHAVYRDALRTAVNDDLGTPAALAEIWKLLSDDTVNMADKRATIADVDNVLGLNLTGPFPETAVEIPAAVQALLDARAQARANKNWSESDRLRDEIVHMGFEVKDTSAGQEVLKRI